MIKENTESNKIKENKYKILRMSLLLGNGDDREDTINNFEDASREIDAMNDEIYQRDLEKKFYDTLTLEEEEKKLSSLVDYIGGRVEQRISLLNDFSNVTGYELNNLPPIKYYDKLDEYKERLSYIREYLDNTKNINKLNTEISDLENQLNDAYVCKAKSEDKNTKDEQELLTKFIAIIKNIKEFRDVSLENADSKLNDILIQVEDSKQSLDIFDKSFATLNQAGISEDEEEEYKSYVTSARDVYYNNKEQEYLLRLYILFNTSESDYNKILSKRDAVNDIIYDRLDLRKELNITTNDSLTSIYQLLERQYNDIKKQKDNIENIEKYSNEISIRKDKVATLEKDNQKVEILSLLKEFCIIDTYEGMEHQNTDLPLDDIMPELNTSINSNIDTDFSVPKQTTNNIETPKSTPVQPIVSEIRKEFKPEEKKIELDITDAKDNQVVAIEDAKKINVQDATIKSNNVMKRVGEMLGVKPKDTTIVNVEEKKEVASPPVSGPFDNQKTPNIDNTKTEEKEIKETPSISVPGFESIPSTGKEENTIENMIGKDNIFDSNNYDGDPEINNQQTPTPIENPLFNNLNNSTIDDIMATNNQNQSTDNSNDEFWYSKEDAPLDLSSLPDIEPANNNNNNFFSTNNSMPELKFPDMNLDFNSNKEEQ